MTRRLLWSAAALLAIPCLDPHTIAAQALDVREWPVEWEGRPRDPAVDADGSVWFVGQAGNYIGVFEPATETFRRFELEPGTMPHNLIVGSDGGIWYAGNGNARIGRIDPATGETRIDPEFGEIREWPVPGGEDAKPYALVADDQDRLWFAETKQGAPRIVGFDTRTSRFIPGTAVSAGIRHMIHHPETNTIWFGTDANNIGRLILP